jgi:COMPASS component SWD3
VQRVEGHTDRVYSVDFHPSDNLLISASADFSVKLWSFRGYGATY